MVATPALIATTCTSSRVVAPRRRPSVMRYSQWSPTTKRGGATFSTSGWRAAQAHRTAAASIATRRDSGSDRNIVSIESSGRAEQRRTILLPAIGDRAETRGRDQLHVLGEHSARVTGSRGLPSRAPAGELAVVDVELNEPAVRIDGDRVAFMHQRDRASDVRFRRDVPDHHSPGATGKAAVGDKADTLAQALPDQCRSRRQHFLHPGTAFRALVANHHYIAGLNLPGH